MKMVENVEKIIGSETFVKDAIMSKVGLTFTVSTVAFGVLAGSQLCTPIWAFKIPYFIGGAYLLFGWVFGEPNTKETKAKSKESVKENLEGFDNIELEPNQTIKVFNGIAYIATSTELGQRFRPLEEREED